MKARGKREARRPWVTTRIRAKACRAEISTPFQGYGHFHFHNQGRRASRLPLAFIFRAFGAISSPRMDAPNNRVCNLLEGTSL